MPQTHTRPFLKWAGSKYSCLSHILDALPAATRLIEPFAGSGCVFINTNYSQYLIGEKNQDLINLFLFIQREGEKFIQYCDKYFGHENNESNQYYLLRSQFNTTTDLRERAALFVYLNRHGYNGLCRYNKRGIFNVPFGSYVKPQLPKKRMEYFLEKSKNVTFKHADFQDIFKLAQPGDVIYCDPPYAPINQISNFTSYTQSIFGNEEQLLLADLAKQASNNGSSVIISNHDTEFTRSIYSGSQIKSFHVSRFISRNITERKPVRELLAVFNCL